MKIRRPDRQQQRGAVAIFVGLFLIVLLTIGALVIDLGRVWNTQTELQNAADADSMAGARGYLLGWGLIYQQANGTPTAGPDWASAAAAVAASAATITGQNMSNGQTLTSNTSISVGYWNSTTGVFRALTSTTTPVSPTPVAGDLPAVKASVTPSALATTFANAIGAASVPVGASSVAVVTGNNLPAATGLFPIAVNQCAASQKELAILTDVVIGYGATTIGPTAPCGQNDTVAQWTNLAATTSGGKSGDSYLTKLINTPVAASSVAVGGTINLDTGAKSSSYSAASNITAGNVLILPVIPDSAFASTGYGPVIGYMAFELVNITESSYPGATAAGYVSNPPSPVYQNGSHSFLYGQFLSKSFLPGSSSQGAGSGVTNASCCFSLTTPPSLVKF